MATSEMLSALMPGAEQLLTCAVCLDFLKIPKILPCHHSFCLVCLENVLGRGYFLVCPKCRREVNITRRGISELPNDFRTDEIKNTLIKITQTKHHIAMCDACRTDNKHTTAIKYCIHCCINMCEECKESHEQTESFSFHIVCDVGNTSGNGEGMCSKHGKGYKYYCMECDKVLCPLCVMGACKQHEVKDLLGALESRRSESLHLLERLDTSLAKHRNLITMRNIDDSSKYDQLSKCVNRHAAYLIAKINENKRRILENVTLDQTRKQVKLEDEKRMLQERIKVINQVKGQITAANKPGMELQLLTNFKSLERVVDNENNRALPFPQNIDKDQLVFAGTEDLSTGLLRKVKMLAEPFLVWHHELPENCWGVEFLPEHGVAVSSGVFGSLWLLARDGTFKALIQENNKAGMFGMVYHDTLAALIAVSPVTHTGKVIDLHTASIVNDIRFADVQEPTGIAILSDSTFVVSDTYVSSCGVSIHTIDGERICSLDHKDPESGKSLFNCPSRIAVDGHDRIIIADEGDCCVKVFSRELELVVTIKQSDGCPPRGICTDTECNIFVASGNTITKYSPSGQWMEDSLVITKESSWKMNGIALDGSVGALAVLGSKDVSYYATLEL